MAGARMAALVDLIVHKYAPLPAVTLGQLVSRLRGGAPQWERLRAAALQNAKEILEGRWAAKSYEVVKKDDKRAYKIKKPSAQWP